MTQSYNPFDDEGDVLIQEQEVVQADNPFDDVVIESTPPDLPIQAVSYNPFDDLDEGNEIDETGVVVSEEPTIARKVAYGASQEPMILGSVGRLVETAYETVFEGKDWEEARADTEAERQEEIFEDFPEFKGGKYDDDGEVIVGKVATAIADPVTYLVPWVKAAKAGKLVLGATGAMTASGEYALHSYALTGEVDPKMLSIVAGSGGTLAVGGDIFIKFLSKRYSKGLTEEQIINKVERRIIKGRDDINDLTAKEQQVITDSFKLASVKDFYGQLKHIDNNTKHLVALKELRASRKAGTITEEVFQTTKTKLNAVLDRKFADMTDMRTAAQVEIAELLYKNKSFSTKAFEVAIRPMFGTLMLGGAGIALDADDSQLYTLMAIGFGSGALSRKLKYNTFLPQKVKQDIMKSVFKRNVAFTLRNIDVNFSATLATKGKALGAETGQFSDMMFHQFKSKGARQLSVEERSTMAYNHWMMTLYDDVIKKSTKKTQTSAVKILRGYDKDSDNTSEALELAGRFRDFFDDYRMYHTDVDIHAVTELDHYFPREYNFDIINKNGKAFKDVLAFIYGKQNPKLTPEKAQKAANGFIKNFYLNSNAPVSEINKQGRQVLDTLPFIKHLQKERELHGTIDIDGIPTQIEELLEPWLKNDPTEILSNMIKESTKTVEFARTWGAKGELLRRLRKKIHDKYAGTAEDKRLYKEHNREIKYINDSINAYFGRYGISDWGGHNAAGSIAMYNNLAMLEDVTLANLGDLIQPFQNSTFFKSAIKGIKITSATKTKTALNSKEPARYLAIGPTNQLQDEIQELSGITNNAAKIISKTNQGFFKMIGLQNITSYARRFAYNTGAIDAFETAKKWTKLNNKNIRAIEKKTGKKWSEFTKEEHIKLIVGSKLTKQTEILRKRLGYAGISTKQAKTLSTFDNFDEAFKSDYKYLLNSAGFRAMERDAKIPTVGNRLLYTQSKNPWLKLVGQFASWAQAKTAQVNSLVSRMEDGEAKLAVKMAGLLSIYGGVKTLREVIADGELSNESKDWAKFLADANQLSGNVGFFGNLASQQYINKYGNDPLNFFPAASTLSKGAEAVRSIDITDPLALTPEIKKILPMPKTINILERTFGREVFEEPSIYKEREYEESKGYSVGGLVSQAERLGFNKGGEVSLDNTSNNSIGIGEQQRLEDYSNTSDNLLPITEGNVVEEPSMWDNISTDYDKRLKSMDESRKDRESREISLVRSTVNTAGAIAGLGFDVAGAVIEESVSTYLDNLKSFAPSTYADTSEKVTEAKDWALNTEAGQVAVAAAQKGYEEYSIWKKDNPQDAKTFEAVLNIGMFGWGAKGIASQMLKRKKPEVLPPINQTKIPPLLVDKTKQGLKVYSDKNASFLNVKKIDDSMVVTNVNVDPTLRRRGVALSMYEEAVKDATTRGVNLTSDMTVKLSAIGVYKKLEALGYDVSFNKNTTDVVNDYGVITRFSTDDLPVVTVHTKKPTEVLPITNKEAERDTALMTLLDDLPVGKQLVIDNSKDYYENDIDYNSAEWFENIARGSEVTVDGNNIIIKKIKEIKLGDIETAVVFPESGKVTIMIPQAGELILEKGGKYNNIEGEWSIETVGLSDEFKNKGLGVKLYLKAVEELLKKGDYAASYLSSGGMTTESAMRVWRSLYKNPDKYLKEFPQLKGTFSIHTNEKNMIVHDNGPKGEKQYEQDIDSEPAYSIELDPSAYEKNIIKRRTPKKPKAAMPAKKTKEVRDNEFKELAKGLTESGGFKYKLPTMLLDLALKDKVGLSKPKQWKYSLSQWAKKGKIKQEELDDSMLMKWLDTIDVDGKLSTKDIFNFMRDNSPMLKTYTSKIQSKVDTEWLDKQPLQQEKIKLQDNAHNKFQEVIYLRDLSNITDISSDNKKLVKTTAEMMHHAIVGNIINYMHSPSFIDNQLMDFLTNSPYTLKAIQRKAVDANLLNKPNSIFHPDHQQLDNKEYIREAAVELVSEVTPDKRNSYIVGAIIEDLNQAYLKAEGREKEVLSKYVNIFMDSYKAKIKQIRFGIENVTELRKLSEEALRRNAGDVNPSTWSSFSLPNMKGKPVTILVQSKVGTDDRLKKLRDFRAEVSEHSKGPYIGHSSELSITGLTTKLNDPTTLPLSAKERIETVRKLKRSKQTFKEKTGVTWEDRQTYLDNLEGNIYTEEHWTGTYGESPLKKGIPQENIIISIRGNVIEQGSLGESRGLFISEQQAQPHQTAMANKKQLDVLGNNLFKNITGYSALDSGAKIKELQRKLKSSEARNKAISGKYRKLQKDYSERYEELEGQARASILAEVKRDGYELTEQELATEVAIRVWRVVDNNYNMYDPKLKSINNQQEYNIKVTSKLNAQEADIAIQIRQLTNSLGTMVNALPENLSHKKDWTPLAMKQSIKYAIDNNLNYLVLPIEKHSIQQIEQWGDREPAVLTAILDRNSIYSPRAYRDIVKKWDKDAKPFNDEYLDRDKQGDWDENDIHKVIVLPITDAIRAGYKKDGLTAYRRGGLVTQMKALIPNG